MAYYTTSATSSNCVWGGWVTNVGYTTGATTDIWCDWNGYGGTGSMTTITCSNVWTGWNTNQGITVNYPVWINWNTLEPYPHYALPAVPETDEQRVAREAQQAEATRQWQERLAQQRERDSIMLKEQAEAKERAHELLLSALSREQQEEYLKSNFFRVRIVDKTGTIRTYRVDHGTHGNVRLIDEAGKILRRYCIQPNGVPTEDAMLAQKLLLETDEEAFLRIANAS